MYNRIDLDTLFEGVYNKLTSPDFGKTLGGELPLFIQPIPTDKQLDVESQIKRLATRLKKKGIDSVSINLYDICMNILHDTDVLEVILEQESEIYRDNIIDTINSVLDVKSVIIPKIKEIIVENNPKYVFISGVGSIFPFVRSHGILNNLDELAEDNTFILFYPGEYNNLQLKLFGILSDENYYRGHNLNEL